MITKYLNKIVQGDCLRVLKNLPDNSIDMAFADPPFNLGKEYHQYIDKLPEKQYLEWSKAWITELIRITKPTGSVFIHNIPEWLTHYAAILNNLGHFQHWLVWDSLARPCRKTFLPSHYGILFYTKEKQGFTFNELRSPHKLCSKCKSFIKDYGNKPRHPFGPVLTDVWSDIGRVQSKELRANHPCPLPEKLLERIILTATNAGDIVLDPFSGTGTTAAVAKKLGRSYIGIEIDPKYVAFSKERLMAMKSIDSQPKYHKIA